MCGTSLAGRTFRQASLTDGATNMGISNAPTPEGKESAEGLRQATSAEERKIEAAKGSPLKKGAKRFEERSRSSDGKDAGSKQE